MRSLRNIIISIVVCGIAITGYTSNWEDPHEAIATSQDNSNVHFPWHAIDNDTQATYWSGAATNTEWIKFRVIEDPYFTPSGTTPEDAVDASGHLSTDAQYAAIKSIDNDSLTYWDGPNASTSDWIRFVINTDTYTTPTGASGSSQDITNGHGYGQAYDNILSTYWNTASGQGLNGWIRFDAGSDKSINGCRIRGASDYVQTVTISIISASGSDSTDVLTGVTVRKMAWQYFSWSPPHNARYIRVKYTNLGGDPFSRAYMSEFDYRTTNNGTTLTNGCEIYGHANFYSSPNDFSQTITISISATDDRPDQYTVVKSNVPLVEGGWNFYKWAPQSTKYIKVAITGLGADAGQPRIREFKYRKLDDNKKNTCGCRIYGAISFDCPSQTATISVSSTDDLDYTDIVLTDQTILGCQWNEFTWPQTLTKYIKVEITDPASATWPQITEFDYDLCGATNVEVSETEFPLSLPDHITNLSKEKVEIKYSVPGGRSGRSVLVNLAIYNVNGQLVKMIVNEHQQPGHYTIWWDGKNEKGNLVANGSYFCHLKANGKATRKLIRIE